MKSVSISLLLAAVLLAHVTYQVYGRSCRCLCLKTSDTVLRKENISHYQRQEAGICHIDAIIFKTVKNKMVCSDPLLPWVKKAIAFVDNKKKATKLTVRPVNFTTTTESTLNTTSHWNTTG